MQFEHPVFSPFYPPGYGSFSPPPGMPQRSSTAYYQEGFGASTIPTPAPSPRTPGSSGRRRSSQYPEFMSSSEYVSARRTSSSRRSGHEHPEFSHERYTTTSPRPGTGHRGATYMYTPVHTPPPPSAHGHHTGAMPNIYAYVPASTPQSHPEYVSFSSPSPRFNPSSGTFRVFLDQRDYVAQRRRAQRGCCNKYCTNCYGQQKAHFPPPSYTPGPQSPPPRDGRRSRLHRRENTWAGESTPRSPPKAGKPSMPPRASTDPTAIDMDAIRRKAAAYGIPADYSLKNWDHNERPVILLGSVFDANSLGEWVYNWTKYHHGRSHDATRTAAGLWELLTEMSTKLKRANEFFPQIKEAENREILADFMESGERLWHKLKGLLKACEEYMWRGARGVASPRPDEGKTFQMGKRSGGEFVDAMFNGEKQWESTERLMRGMATWCQRFEVNCEEILRSPDA